VVTFTKAATAELRERIRARIRELRDSLAQEPGAPHDPSSPGLPRRSTKPGRRRASIELLHRRALESFDEASIFTIHGFCQPRAGGQSLLGRLADAHGTRGG